MERSETGVSLKVTPHVNAATGEITMLVEPRIARAEATEFEFEGEFLKTIRKLCEVDEDGNIVFKNNAKKIDVIRKKIH